MPTTVGQNADHCQTWNFTGFEFNTFPPRASQTEDAMQISKKN